MGISDGSISLDSLSNCFTTKKRLLFRIAVNKPFAEIAEMVAHNDDWKV